MKDPLNTKIYHGFGSYVRIGGFRPDLQADKPENAAVRACRAALGKIKNNADQLRAEILRDEEELVAKRQILRANERDADELSDYIRANS